MTQEHIRAIASQLSKALFLRWEDVSPRPLNAVGPNTETDFFTRISNLEAACFPGGLNNGSLSPVFQGPAQSTFTVYVGATDALAYPGTALLNRSGAVDAATLATPVVGTDDNKTITIINGAAQANTVTTASGKIVDGTSTAKDTITFAAHVGGSIELKAYQGLWYVINTPLNATLTAV